MLEASSIGYALTDMQFFPETVSDRVISQFNARNFEILLCLLEKKSESAAYFQQFTARAKAPDEIDSARELASEDGFRTKIVRVSVGMASRKVIGGVIGLWIEIRGLGTPKTAG